MISTIYVRLAACVLLAAALAACSSAATAPMSDAFASAPRAMRSSDGPYLLGPGDRLRIKVYNDADMTGEYEVNSAGIVSVPLVGDVRVAGHTAQQVERTLVARMKGKISEDPKVNVELAAYAPFYVHGEVKKSGEYPYRPGLTLGDAIATAGGLTYRANEGRIYLRRAGSPIEDTVSLDMRVRVYPGDNIRVSERIF